MSTDDIRDVGVMKRVNTKLSVGAGCRQEEKVSVGCDFLRPVASWRLVCAQLRCHVSEVRLGGQSAAARPRLSQQTGLFLVAMLLLVPHLCIPSGAVT